MGRRYTANEAVERSVGEIRHGRLKISYHWRNEERPGWTVFQAGLCPAGSLLCCIVPVLKINYSKCM